MYMLQESSGTVQAMPQKSRPAMSVASNTRPVSPPASGPTPSSTATSRVVGPPAAATLRDDGAAAHSPGPATLCAGSPDGSAAPPGTGADAIAKSVADQLLLAAVPCSGPDVASIEWLPKEVLVLAFGFVGAKTLTASIPAVSPCGMWVG